ncbi:Fis family transcriptional regulator [Rhizobium rhizosphaerae]|uniref:Fis family transcriptional regulator n=1 Tax=Xaviernesmea rhizosphaerae TaxID=1672749 RepID=A0ABX3PHC8_9HYPH|nr:sigma-54 dependent transcriptional regulator [Xaviernesmea rhizosphaerae]OQP87423.1 Fis family transcriptional regulator [Xaviernesmea rhizosphaerae]
MTQNAPDRILLVDDNPAFRAALADSFAIAGLEVELHEDGQSALASLSGTLPGVVVTDLRMPRLDGNDLFEAILARDRELPVILMTGHGDIAMAVAALKRGAFDFLAKPFMTDHLIASVRRALETRRLVVENRRLRQAALEAEQASPLLGQTPAMVQLRDMIQRIAHTDVNVLIEGETGTGKELIARLLHQGSPRRGRPFIRVDCAAVTEAMVDDTLFGTRLRRGQIAEAQRGTLFLDGAEAMSPLMQGRMLAIAENREMPSPAGGMVPVDVRIIAATKKPLAGGEGTTGFREDLLYHLETVRVSVPPLRARRGDIALLFNVFLEDAARRHGLASVPMDAAIETCLLTGEWPGNVRELRNYATQVALGLAAKRPALSSRLGLAEQMDAFEASVLTQALQNHGGDANAVAQALKLPRRSLYARLQRLNIQPAVFRASPSRKARDET